MRPRQPFQARLSISLPIFTNFSRTQRISEARAQHGDMEEAVRARGLAVQTEVMKSTSAAYSVRVQQLVVDGKPNPLTAEGLVAWIQFIAKNG